MNQSELTAYILTRQRIVDQIDNIVKNGGSKDTLKRLRRFGNAFSWYPEFYPQILADINGMSDKQLMSALRTEDSFMKAIAPVKGLPIHHKIANRTGGDVALRTPADVFLDVRQMIYDKYGGFPGNSAWNLGAQGAIDERQHQGRWGAKGTVFDKAKGYGADPNPMVAIAHGPGQKQIGEKLGLDPVLLRSQATEIFNELDPFLEKQVKQFQRVVESPTVKQQRAVIQTEIDPEAFAQGRTVEQSKAVAKKAAETGADVRFAKAFNFDKGVARLVVGGGALMALQAAGSKVLAGDFEGAAGEVVAGVVGEVPLAGDVAVMEAEGRAAGKGSAVPTGMTGAKYTQQQIKRAKEAKTFEQKLANEAQWAMKNPGEAALNVAKGTVSLFKQGFLQSPMGQPFNYLPQINK